MHSMHNDMYADVAAFHQLILEVERPEQPTWRESTWLDERIKFLDEERREMLAASSESDMVGVVDALIDTIYVALGTLYMMGVPVQECWDAVQHANMSKVKGVGKRGNKIDAIKPDGWVGPEAIIHAALVKAGYSEDNA